MYRDWSGQDTPLPLPEVGDEALFHRRLRADDASDIARLCGADREILR